MRQGFLNQRGLRGRTVRLSRCVSPAKRERIASCAVRKLRSSAGDTFIEILAALLIAALATVLMATMIVTSTNITSRNETRMAALYAAQSTLSNPTDAERRADISTASIAGTTTGSFEVGIVAYGADGYLRYGVAEEASE